MKEKNFGADYEKALAQIQACEEYGEKVLVLRGMDINRIPKEVGHLTNLEELYLSSTGVEDISSLSGLEGLEVLDLSSTGVEDISSLSGLEGLKVLNLSSTGVEDISSLSGLEGLKVLNLSSTGVEDISSLSGLEGLGVLDLSSTGVEDISSLSGLEGLKVLNLSNTGVEDISSLSGLEGLGVLDLSSTGVEDISSLSGLNNLMKLNLSGTQVTTLRSFHKETKGEYDYRAGQPDQFWMRPDNQLQLFLHNCTHLREPSLEWVQAGTEAVNDYFNAIEEQGKETFYEAKLILIGAGQAGKTSLSKKLRDTQAMLSNKQEATLGAEVERWEYEYEGNHYVVHLWDFGGQDTQYALHQFLMTERATYVLVENTRASRQPSNDVQSNADYWLESVEKLGKESPTFYFYNCHTDCPPNEEHFRRVQQHETYGTFVHKEQFAVNLNEVANDSTAAQDLEAFREQLKQTVAGLPNVGLVLPKKWASLKRWVQEEAKTKDWVGIEVYREQCKAMEVYSETQQNLILRYLHQTGDVIHYRELDNGNDTLHKIVILNRQWATKAIYQVIVYLEGIRQGYFDKNSLRTIWNSPQNATYRKHCAELIQLMRRFDICYPVQTGRYLIPNCLSSARPDQVSIPLKGAYKQLHYQYEYLPYGLINRLSVRLNEYIKEEEIWKYGAVLNHKQGKITIVEHREGHKGTIRLYIEGEEADRYYLLQRIQEQLEQLHETTNISEGTSLMVPCCCTICTKETRPEYYPYEKRLLNRLRNGKKNTIECPSSEEDILLLDLIDHAFFERPEAVTRIIEEKHNHIHYHMGDVGKIQHIEGNQTIHAELFREHNVAMNPVKKGPLKKDHSS